jgi:hypothetical protein
MSRPSGATPGGRAYLELQRRARRDGVGTQELLVWYVHERFLCRVASSPHRDRLILKGGMLLVAFDARRATQDIDLLGQGVSAETSAVRAMIAEIAQIEMTDGVRFDSGRIASNPIRDNAPYAGVRITMPAAVDRAMVTLRLDISTGDPVTPAPIDVVFPSLLDAPFTLRGYPVATVLAEKIVTLIERGDANTRDRDVADIVVLIRPRAPDADEVLSAIRATAAYRGVPLRPVREAVVRLGELRQSSWRAFVERSGVSGLVPNLYTEALDEVAAFVDPLLAS